MFFFKKFKDWVDKNFPAFLILILGTFFRFLYIFGFTNPAEQLYGDMAGYNWRAIYIVKGPGLVEPSYQSSTFDTLLSLVFRVTDFFQIFDYNIAIYTTLGILSGTVTLFALYQISKILFDSSRLSIIILSVLSLWFPLIHLQAFLVLENVFIALMFLGLYFYLRSVKAQKIPYFGFGLMLFTGAIRPNFMLFVFILPFFLWWFSKYNLGKILKLVFVGCGLVVVILGLNFWSSNGHNTSLSAGGGANFALTWCDVGTVQFLGKDGAFIWFKPPARSHYDPSKTLTLDKRFENQGVYYEAGLECIKKDPSILYRNINSTKNLFDSVYYPRSDRMFHGNYLLDLFKIFTIVFFVLSLFGLILALRKTSDNFHFLFYPILVGTLVFGVYLQNPGEERYLTPYTPIFVIYALVFVDWLVRLVLTWLKKSKLKHIDLKSRFKLIIIKNMSVFMADIVSKFSKHFFKLSFLLILLSYFFMGVMNINSTGLSADEPAHLGAAYAYTQGKSANLEHPPLLKFLNAIVLQINFDTQGTVYLNQYETGKNWLMQGNNDPQQVIFYSRLVYLVFNSILIFYLFLLCFVWKILRPFLGFLMVVLYTFSPSFGGHSFLITFDVSGAITLLMFVISLVLAVQNWSAWDLKNRSTSATLVIFTSFLALSTKFSNLIILPILLLTFLVVCVRYGVLKKWRQVRQSVTLLAIGGLVNLFLLAVVIWPTRIVSDFVPYYRTQSFPAGSFMDVVQQYAFELAVGDSRLSALAKYVFGMTLTLARSGDLTYLFWDGSYQVITYQTLISRVFWFKENPFFILFLGFLPCLLLFRSRSKIQKFWSDLEQWSLNKSISRIFTNFKKDSILKLNTVFAAINKDKFINFFKSLDKYKVWVFVLFLAAPMTYFMSARNLYLTIGYRHFYPVLIFIYFGLSYLICVFTKEIFAKIVLGVLLVAYSFSGLLGFSQNISYVNELWTRPKWELTSDSTINWGQGVYQVYVFFQNEGLLQGKNENKIIHNIFVLPYLTAENYTQVTGIRDTEISMSYGTFTDLSQTKISDLDYSYLVIDSTSLQTMKTFPNGSLPRQNLDFVLSQWPVYSYNDIIFVYKIK
jgi:hypothetical protein